MMVLRSSAFEDRQTMPPRKFLWRRLRRPWSKAALPRQNSLEISREIETGNWRCQFWNEMGETTTITCATPARCWPFQSGNSLGTDRLHQHDPYTSAKHLSQTRRQQPCWSLRNGTPAPPSLNEETLLRLNVVHFVCGPIVHLHFLCTLGTDSSRQRRPLAATASQLGGTSREELLAATSSPGRALDNNRFANAPLNGSELSLRALNDRSLKPVTCTDQPPDRDKQDHAQHHYRCVVKVAGSNGCGRR